MHPPLQSPLSYFFSKFVAATCVRVCESVPVPSKNSYAEVYLNEICMHVYERSTL